MDLTNDQLLSALGAAIRSADQGGNTTAADVRGFLAKLLDYIQQGQDGAADQLAQKEQVGVAEGLVATERTRLDQLLDGATDTLSANHLAANTYLIGQNKQIVLAYDDSNGALRVGTYENSRITFSATDYEFFTKSYARLSLRLHNDGTVYVVNNLGVGTSSPSERVEVIGNVKAEKFMGDGSQLTGLPAAMLYDSTGQATDGAMTQQAVTNQLATVAHLAQDEQFTGNKTFQQAVKAAGYFGSTGMHQLTFSTIPFYDGPTFRWAGVDRVQLNFVGGQSGKNLAFVYEVRNAYLLNAGNNDVGEFYLSNPNQSNGSYHTNPRMVFFASGPATTLVRNGARLGVGTDAPTESIETTGNVKAEKFIGDGSQLTGLPSSGLTITQLPAFTASAGGVQTISLPRAGAAPLNLQVLAADGHVATIWPGYVSIAGTTLTIAADANILAGDKVAGSYY